MASSVMKAQQLRELNPSELQKRSDEITQELYELRRKQATGQIDNPARLTMLRKQQARILTVLRELLGKV